jgi:hypothetical protein
MRPGKDEEGQYQLAVLPKLMLSSPPIVLPARSASRSVPRRSQSASTVMAAAPVRKTQVGGASKR